MEYMCTVGCMEKVKIILPGHSAPAPHVSESGVIVGLDSAVKKSGTKASEPQVCWQTIAGH